MKIETVFQIVAVVLGGAAAYFLFTGNKDGAFISAVLGSVAFFLSVRFQVKARNTVREAEREAAYESEAAAVSPESND
jgi:hypothetical protein